ncbi:MAG: sigma-E processing peptidase SpoIIGA [Ruminococcus sp.]|nr:sigma-E processing peptidase SpoIIGA [Ruminococcus sp.]
MKIYIDVLVITNAVITLIYIWCISKITHDDLPLKREIAAAAIGGIGSLLAAAQSNSFFTALLITLCKPAIVALIILTAFHPKKLLSFFKRILLYLMCELLMGGACYALVSVTKSPILCIKNYTVYFDISLLDIAICCGCVYLIITLFEAIQRRHAAYQKRYHARYKLGGFELSVPAIADTGNRLCDSFTGAPIVIFRSDKLYSQYNLSQPEQLAFYGFHPVPFETINGMGLIYVTSKGSITISSKDESKTAACCLGVMERGGGSEYAIFNPSILD